MCLLPKGYGISGVFHRYLIFSSFQFFFFPPLIFLNFNAEVLQGSGFPGLRLPRAQWVKNLPAVQEMQEMLVPSLGRENSMEESMKNPTPAFLPGRLHGQRSLAGYS